MMSRAKKTTKKRFTSAFQVNRLALKVAMKDNPYHRETLHFSKIYKAQDNLILLNFLISTQGEFSPK